MTLESATGGPFPVGLSPKSTADRWPSDYTIPFTDYRSVLPQEESIEGKLDRIIALLEQLVKNL